MRQSPWFRVLLCGIVLLASSGAQKMSNASPPRGQLVIVGGGEPLDAILRRTLEVAGGSAVRVLVVPHASVDLESGYRMAEVWKELGAESVEVLDLSDPRAALEVVKNADLIWFKGGEQERLMRALETAGLVDAIRDRFADGGTIAGTSAGAAVMTRLMIAGSRRAPDDPTTWAPRIAPGLGLWPEAVVDQHFLKRNRLPRLLSVVNDHPGLVGVGIDECAGVVVRGQRFEVIGDSQVYVIDARHARRHHGVPTIVSLEPGTMYHLERGILEGPAPQ
jgi:cyanophycinase